MRNFKTDKWYKVVVDYVDWYYKWNDVKEYVWLDEKDWWVVYMWNQELASIDDIGIADEWVNYLLYRKLWEWEEFIDKRDTSDFEDNKEWYESNYLHFEKEYELRPFYVSYYWSGQYRVQFSEAKEADWILFIKRKEDKEHQERAERNLKKAFEHYMNGEIYQVAIYAPHEARFVDPNMKNQKIIYYEYEDGSCYLFSEEEVIESLPEHCWNLLKETESSSFESFELQPITDN